MKRLLRFAFRLLCTCLGFSFLLTPFEKKKGWVEGHTPYGPYEKYFKRPLDFGLALFALILLWPILLIIGIAVRINMGCQVIFTQKRPGLGGEIFKIKKFRTMTDARDSDGILLPDEERITKLGTFLRRTSCDELPELLNIVEGSMSFIGPRPLLEKYLPYYTDREKLRHSIRPGLTGYAQVHGRNEITWEKKFELDAWYAEHVSLKTDLNVIIDTIKVVLSHDGVSLNALEDFDEYRKHSANTNR